jgi:hypothetical protein
MRRVRPYVSKERQDIRRIEQLLIPTLERLLPLLINCDFYSIEAWNKAVETQLPLREPTAITLSGVRSVFSNLWVRVVVAAVAAFLVLAFGSTIQGADFWTYFKLNYSFFWGVLLGFEALVIAHAGLAQRREKGEAITKK